MSANDNEGGGFVPRREREQTDREERLRAALFATIDDATDMRETALVLGAYAVRSRTEAVYLERSLDQAIEHLVDFDLRCGLGDVNGAVCALRAWLEELR